jgi:serine/threonine protein phosphatase PrpC
MSGVKWCLGVGDAERHDCELPQGAVCVRSVRSPDKETSNEDAAAIIPVGDHALVLAVADGVGGNPGGHEASMLAVRTVEEFVSRSGEVGQLRTAILDGIEAANRRVLDLNRGAATTLAVAEIVGAQVRCYHVGDSELISVGQRGRVKLRVVPHSPTGFAVEAGLMDENEAVQHDQRHVLFNVIGSLEMRIDMGASLRFAPHDTLLLATDGLMDNLFVSEITDIIRTGALPGAADALVAAAQARMRDDEGGGPSKPDDLTVILHRSSVVRSRRVRRAKRHVASA